MLLELITLEGGFVAKLYATDCITNFQRQSIEAAGDHVKMNSRLLHIMLRKSVANFNRFIDCLSETGQGHVAAMLLTKDAGSTLRMLQCRMSAVAVARPHLVDQWRHIGQYTLRKSITVVIFIDAISVLDL